MFPRQAIILCGGLGTRLGALTANTPKPLLEFSGIPFLETLIREVSRSGIRRFLLLAGHRAHKIEAFAAELNARLGSGYLIEVNIECEPAGTGGALFEAKEKIDDLFLLLNGDSLIEIAVHELGATLRGSRAGGAIALRHVPDASRYGQVFLDGETVSRFVEKASQSGPGLINGGVYLLRKSSLDILEPRSSLERDFLPKLAEQRRLVGKTFESFFIDIGLPASYAEAGQLLLAHRRRPAAFLDRDGVLNEDAGHVGTIDRWEWTAGAMSAIRRLNRAGYYVFVVTNQAGIAKGKYKLEDYWRLRDHIREQLFDAHAQVDDERFCPYHPEGVIEEWRGTSDWRKPGPGMINDLLASWPVDLQASFLIGDQQSDLQAATKAGIRSHLFRGGDLDQFVSALLTQ